VSDEDRSLRLEVSTPSGTLSLGPLASLRFATHDGWRGVWPGHEPGRASLHGGPIRLASVDGEVRWLATEGGVILIERRRVRVLARWATTADTLTQLREQVEARDAERSRIEREAQAVGRRHEIATRRALMALERKVSAP
jgi:F0F1-type ATP synthase epsilon subunit